MKFKNPKSKNKKTEKSNLNNNIIDNLHTSTELNPEVNYFVAGPNMEQMGLQILKQQ